MEQYVAVTSIQRLAQVGKHHQPVNHDPIL